MPSLSDALSLSDARRADLISNGFKAYLKRLHSIESFLWSFPTMREACSPAKSVCPIDKPIDKSDPQLYRSNTLCTCAAVDKNRLVHYTYDHLSVNQEM